MPTLPNADVASGGYGSLPRTVDAHHHLWDYSSAEYPWIDQSMESIRRDFRADDLSECLRHAQISGTVAVQARQTMAETEWLLQIAEKHRFIYGVVGWAPIQNSHFGSILHELTSHKKLVGLRHVVQAEPEGFLDQDDFNRGIKLLSDTTLVYDILILEHQLTEAIRFVDRHPDQQFVLDHCGKPKIRSKEMDPWRKNIRDLAKRPNVACKVSGLVTEADWHHWSIGDLEPYLDVCVEAFGTDRIMVGSDWPVCLVATQYENWWQLMRSYFDSFTASEKLNLFGGTCCNIYNLSEQVTGQ